MHIYSRPHSPLTPRASRDGTLQEGRCVDVCVGVKCKGSAPLAADARKRHQRNASNRHLEVRRELANNMPPSQRNDAHRPHEEEGGGERLLSVVPVPHAVFDRAAVGGCHAFRQVVVGLVALGGGLGPREERRGDRLRHKLRHRARARAKQVKRARCGRRGQGAAVPLRVGERKAARVAEVLPERRRLSELTFHLERVRW
ncbi:hypothetical protein T484DRAFT_1984145 [Baffinella frigidus]|nr:hypothetical protein T484DRAFT_1984145 [Cryptophyta sp. CCMP2293]|mmetsp:Transcript_37098/g.84396  ORF Transcript_37098/g.84396 Transcript_37098/m.84396 type:complete len:200 (+) Transcript_37098:14-613(+)